MTSMTDQSDGAFGSTGAAFTPGPWHVEPMLGEDEEQFWSDDWNGKVFCVCHPQTQCDATTVVDWINEGDARLIAAAPDMLTALKDAIGALEQDLDAGKDSGDADWEGLAHQRLEAARAAIALATGAAA